MNNTRILLVAGRERQTGVPKYRSPWAVGARERVLGEGGGVGPLPHGASEEKDKGGAAKSVDWRKTSSIKGEGMAEHSFIHGTGAKFKKGMEWCHLYHDSSWFSSWHVSHPLPPSHPSHGAIAIATHLTPITWMEGWMNTEPMDGWAHGWLWRFSQR